MKRSLICALLFGFVAGLFCIGTVDAQDKKKKRPDRAAQFKKLDKNEDGKLSLEEFLASFDSEEAKEKGKRAFARLDKDKDGFLSLEEFTARPERKKKKDDN